MRYFNYEAHLYKLFRGEAAKFVDETNKLLNEIRLLCVASGVSDESCFFGCDRCQEVCPFNGPERRRDTLLPSADKFLRMDNDYFLERFGKTAFARAGFEKIKTNIQVIKRART